VFKIFFLLFSALLLLQISLVGTAVMLPCGLQGLSSRMYVYGILPKATRAFTGIMSIPSTYLKSK
jgi:hypothetical protein